MGLAIGTMAKDQKIDSLFDSLVLKVDFFHGNFSNDESDGETRRTILHSTLHTPVMHRFARARAKQSGYPDAAASG